MTNRLSDERLRRLHYWARNLGTTEGDTAADAISELLELRAKLAALEEGMPALGRALLKAHDDWGNGYKKGLEDAHAAGPVMPEVPSNAVIYAIEVEKVHGTGGATNFYNAIRHALLKGQSR